MRAVSTGAIQPISDRAVQDQLAALEASYADRRSSPSQVARDLAQLATRTSDDAFQTALVSDAVQRIGVFDEFVSAVATAAASAAHGTAANALKPSISGHSDPLPADQQKLWKEIVRSSKPAFAMTEQPSAPAASSVARPSPGLKPLALSAEWAVKAVFYRAFDTSLEAKPKGLTEKELKAIASDALDAFKPVASGEQLDRARRELQEIVKGLPHVTDFESLNPWFAELDHKGERQLAYSRGGVSLTQQVAPELSDLWNRLRDPQLFAKTLAENLVTGS